MTRAASTGTLRSLPPMSLLLFGRFGWKAPGLLLLFEILLPAGTSASVRPPDDSSNDSSSSSNDQCPVCLNPHSDPNRLSCSACRNQICRYCVFQLASRCAGVQPTSWGGRGDAARSVGEIEFRTAARRVGEILGYASIGGLPQCPLCRAVWTNAGAKVAAMAENANSVAGTTAGEGSVLLGW